MLDLNNFLLLEKRISQIKSNIDVTFSFDIIKTIHAEDRSDFSKRGLPGEDQSYISNAEISEFVSLFKANIAEDIVLGDIVDQTQFVIRSDSHHLSMAIIAEQKGFNYWNLIIKTVFRENENNKLKTAKDQLIYEI